MQSRIPINCYFTIVLLIMLIIIQLMMSGCSINKGSQKALDNVVSYKPFDALFVRGIPYKDGNSMNGLGYCIRTEL